MYVFELPFIYQKSLASVLDLNSDWEKLAASASLSCQEIYFLRQTAARGQSPSEELLRALGCSGFTVERVLNLLQASRLVRAFEVLQPCVCKDGEKSAEMPLRGGTSSDDTDGRCYVAAGVIGVQHHSVEDVSHWLPADQHHLKHLDPAVSKHPAPSAGHLASGDLSTSFDELRLATDNFSQANVIGQGGYGTVYKGRWKDTVVAIKRISFRHRDATCSATCLNEIAGQVDTEMKALSTYRHDNILSLYAFCLENADACLVYQFMPGGSLDTHLFNPACKPLKWNQRLRIMVGSCRGLNYLHTFRSEPLVHGDVKSANILLDKYLEPKIGDFGLACKIDFQQAGALFPGMPASHIKGTLAYLPPEYISKKLISPKLDVYSFGVVLLEVATGMRSYSVSKKYENLVSFLTREKSTCGTVAHLRDHRLLEGDENDDVFSVLVSLGFECTVREPSQRPDLSHVLKRLENTKVT